ncbi:PGPGW domain-containing protein [Corallincola platygyrae]|uniref:PGPGW domain-containing protein n=1 Tax=Corallincola platygyrae TaxID=1193278 RepID=A0ABW4XJA6_9GAMM
MKNMFISLTGGFLLIVGIVCLLTPLPGALFIVFGLALLSINHLWARVWLKRSQDWMSKAARAIDKKRIQKKLYR